MYYWYNNNNCIFFSWPRCSVLGTARFWKWKCVVMDAELHCQVEDIDVWSVQMLICVSPVMRMELFRWMDTRWNTISFTSCKRHFIVFITYSSSVFYLP